MDEQLLQQLNEVAELCNAFYESNGETLAIAYAKLCKRFMEALTLNGFSRNEALSLISCYIQQMNMGAKS